MIETAGLRKAYGHTVVVDDVTLEIPSGGVTSIIGPNGAGKSTLLGMIARLLPANAGTVLVDGLDVSTARSDEVARRLSILRQDNHLAVRLTVRDLVGFGRYCGPKGVRRRWTGNTSSGRSAMSGSTDSRTDSSTRCPVASGSGFSWRWCSVRTPSTCSWTSR
jgi:ABC-type enterochelin transport system ATPase subunit